MPPVKPTHYPLPYTHTGARLTWMSAGHMLSS